MGKKKDAKAGGKGLRKVTNRRQFLKVAGIGGLSAASLYLLGCAAEEITTTETATVTTTATVTGPGVTTTVTAPGATTTVTTGPGTTVTTTAPGVTTTVTATVAPEEIVWDYEADVVCIGAGSMGVVTAIAARDAGASVIVVEQNYDIGGRSMGSAGQIDLGGGNVNQIANGIVDDAETLFKDFTDWSIERTQGHPDYRYSDREQARVFADQAVTAYNWLLANGWYTEGDMWDRASGTGVSARRTCQSVMEGMLIESPLSPTASHGSAYARPLEASARAKGAQYMLNRHMDEIYRESQFSGRVLGIRASYTPRFNPDTGAQMLSYRTEGNIDETQPTVNIKANKAVIIGTAGYAGNVDFRRRYDARQTEEVQMTQQAYTGPAGQGAGGHIAAENIGASIWGVYGQYEHGWAIGKYSRLGNLLGDKGLTPQSPVFPFARATGLNIGGAGFAHVICVNQVGKRFYDETKGGHPGACSFGNQGVISPMPHVIGDWRNTIPTTLQPYSKSHYIDAARAINEGSVGPEFDTGPTWAIFDAAAVARQEWDINPPITNPEYFLSGGTLTELAGKIVQNPFSKVAMPAANLEATVATYNSFADTGVDTDFAKPAPMYRIDTPPFYAAWAPIMWHDAFGGLRINRFSQIIDRWGEVIPSLYCGGEATGGTGMHGLTLGLIRGIVAGPHAAALTSW